MKKLKVIIAILISGFIITSFTIKLSDAKPWPVPDAAKNKKSPVAASAEAVAGGKALWSTHCKSCHGAKGVGDGTKAAQLKTEPGDFSKADVQSQTDGEIFYKLSEGRDDMPAFKKKISDEDERWSLVQFIRTMKK